MTTIALEGTGTTITFSASSFTSDLIALTLSDRARETIETTHLGTTGAKTFKPAKDVDLGTIVAVFDHRPEEITLVNNPPELITITYPLQPGQVVPDALQIPGFIFKQGGQRMEMDGRMVTRVEIRITTQAALGGSGGGGGVTPPPVNLVDPKLWIAAFDFDVDGNQNLVDVTSGSTLLLGAMNFDTGKYPDRSQTIGVLPNYNPGYNGTRAPVSAFTDTGNPVATATTGTQPTSGDFNLLTYSVGHWVKNTEPTRALDGGGSCTFDSAGTSRTAALASSGMYMPGIAPTPSTVHPGGNFRHFTYDNGSWRYYEDGLLISSGVTTATPFPFDRVYCRGTTIANYAANNVSPEIHDNIVIYAGMLSDAAIAALAAGHMPDAAGNLY